MNGDNPRGGQGETPLALRLLDAIAKNPGVIRKGLYEALGGHVKADALGEALAWLKAQGLAHVRQSKVAGRPAKCWYPGPEPEPPDEGAANGESPCEQTNKLGPIPEPQPEPGVVRSLAHAPSVADAVGRPSLALLVIQSDTRAEATANAEAEGEAREQSLQERELADEELAAFWETKKLPEWAVSKT